MDISYYDYNYYSSKPRVYDYSVYATDEADVSGMTALAEKMCIRDRLWARQRRLSAIFLLFCTAEQAFPRI